MTLGTYYQLEENKESAFVVEATKIKFGKGTMHEIGDDAHALALKRVAVYTDPTLAHMEPLAIVKRSLAQRGVDFEIYDQVEVEPTDRSFQEASQFAQEGRFDGFISLGGGSVMDTCKAANLYSTYPDEFLSYVNAPIGHAKPISGKLKPHIACPTTFGTASECTGNAIFDFLEMHAKTGIVGAALKPTLGILDPLNLKTLPPLVIAANGFDVFSHACESYTARPYTKRDFPKDPAHRPLGQGANPYSDIACINALRIMGEHLVTTVLEKDYDEGFENLMFAGMLAGIGFGNAGCHLPHGMSYAVSGCVKDYVAEGWPSNNPLVPHGISVIVNAPSVFRQTAKACPDRHLDAAEAVGVDISGASKEEGGHLLADHIIGMMKKTHIPNGLKGVGYNESDLDRLTEGAFPQKRLLDNAPLSVDKSQLKQLFQDALEYW